MAHVVDSPQHIYRNNHLITTYCRDAELWVTGVSHCSSNMKTVIVSWTQGTLETICCSAGQFHHSIPPSLSLCNTMFAESCPLTRLPGCHTLLFPWQPAGSFTLLRVTSQHSLEINHSNYNWFMNISDKNGIKNVPAIKNKLRCRERFVLVFFCLCLNHSCHAWHGPDGNESPAVMISMEYNTVCRLQQWGNIWWKLFHIRNQKEHTKVQMIDCLD